jgi:hypothetical protein
MAKTGKAAPAAKKITIPKVVKPFGTHCHERVYLAMELLKSATKAAIAECAVTTENVVSNAIHDFKKGMYTKTGKAVNCKKEKAGKNFVYALS